MQFENISVTVPFSQAVERVKTVLFRPFDIGKWFVIGFCAWLAYLGEGGVGGGTNFGGGHHGGVRGMRHEIEQARDYVMNNIGWIAPIVLFAVVVILAIALLVLWLSSRGRFMFLHCVALNRAEVRVPWERFASEANSLFLFRIVLFLIGAVVFLPLVGGLLFLVMQMALRETFSPVGILFSSGLLFAMVVAGVLFWIIGRLLKDFVVPIQFLRRTSCMNAWRELRSLFSGNVANVVVYLLFRILLSFAIGLGILILVFATCCIAGCLLAIPYLGTVFLLPVLVFERSYSLHYLAQYGRDYDVFSPMEPAAG